MAATTGPILAIGAITMINQNVFNNEPVNWRIPVATGIAASLFGLLEKGWADGAKMLAWSALVTICFARLDPKVPSPAESALAWWNPKKK